MCERRFTKLEDIIHRLHDKKEERDSALAHVIRNNDIIPNVCGAMFDIKGLKKWPNQWIGNYYFKPCRTKGVHPGKKDEPIVCQIHHINGDCTDDRPENLVRLCLLCHVEVELLLRRQHSPNIHQFRDWFRSESYTTSKGFKKVANLGNLPGHIPPNPTTFYAFRNEWDKYGGWEYIIPKKNFKLAVKAGTKMRARMPNLKSWTAHIRLLKKHKIVNKPQWNKLIKKISGNKKKSWTNSSGYLTSDAFVRIYRKEWLKFGGYTTRTGTTIIRFHWQGKHADWSHARNIKSIKKKSAALKKAIKEAIKNEPKDSPYTDDQLRKKLKRKSVEVVRKYRNLMGIKSYLERKKDYARRSTKRNRKAS